ncbi:hypothetical protein [Noviluteimonas gilva]|uniref:DUF2846 domain-containing protein n=1 Tax=Noviluteimonas gilva TaxID=2682097 RepID=A0A7C9M343_9GAMM|nr:hypothetical protein [Lysobacter gilvus]MUV15508.1 hypothetical protein [Lysobacter gilvus]
MHRSTKLAALAALLFATAWGKPKGTFKYEVDASTPPNETAIIRAALRSEKQFKSSAIKRIFVQDSWTQFLVISRGYDIPGAANVKKYAAVRVKPGKYLARVVCNGMFIGSFDMEVDVQAGGEYLLECSGDGHSMRAHVWRKDQPTVADAAVATPAATTADTPNGGAQATASASSWVAPWSWK